MDKLIIALFETSVALVLFYVVFVFWLKKETFFRENRFYLLLTAGFSLLIPWINFSLPSSSTTTVMVYNLLDVVSVTANGYEKSLINTITTWQWIFIVYAVGVVVMLGLLIVNMIKVTRIDKISHQNFGGEISKDVRFIEADVVPFSFFNKIYINPNNYSQNQLNDIIAHESVHLRQQHTYDCLFYELLIVFFWFNPIVYKYRASAKELHEFLADEGAIRSGIAEVEYKKLLFEQATGLKTLTVANSFNYSLIKRRLIMLTKIKSSKVAKVRLLLVMPIVLALVLVFSFNTNNTLANTGKKVIENKNVLIASVLSDSNNVKHSDQVFFIVEEMPEFPGGDLAIMDFFAKNTKYPEEAKKTETEGTVYVQFVVNEQGEIEQVKFLKTKVPIFDKNGKKTDSYTEVFHRAGKNYEAIEKEAVRVVSSLPKWKSGKQRGKNVKVSYTVPIKFALN